MNIKPEDTALGGRTIFDCRNRVTMTNATGACLLTYSSTEANRYVVSTPSNVVDCWMSEKMVCGLWH
jgi:hypothetical protein